MISPTAEYALRAVVALAQADGEALVNSQIAEITKVPQGYLAKVLQTLRKAGIVRSKRGLGGGFVLAKPPEALSVLEVVGAVDPIKRIRECPLGIETHSGSLCALHKRLDAAAAAVEKSFAETTLAEVLADSGGAKPLCQSDERKGTCAEPEKGDAGPD